MKVKQNRTTVAPMPFTAKNLLFIVTENPLYWWKVNRCEFKTLSKLACRYFTPLPASILSEQLFSGAGLIHNPLRNMLKDDKAATLIFIKHNSPSFKFNY